MIFGKVYLHVAKIDCWHKFFRFLKEKKKTVFINKCKCYKMILIKKNWPKWEIKGGRERDTERERDRERERETERETETDREGQRQRARDRVREMGREGEGERRQRQRDRDRETETERQRETHTHIETTHVQHKHLTQTRPLNKRDYQKANIWQWLTISTRSFQSGWNIKENPSFVNSDRY